MLGQGLVHGSGLRVCTRWLRPHPPLREFALRGGGGSEAAAATPGLASPHAPAGAEGESVAGDKQGGGGSGLGLSFLTEGCSNNMGIIATVSTL